MSVAFEFTNGAMKISVPLNAAGNIATASDTASGTTTIALLPVNIPTVIKSIDYDDEEQDESGKTASMLENAATLFTQKLLGNIGYTDLSITTKITINSEELMKARATNGGDS